MTVAIVVVVAAADAFAVFVVAKVQFAYVNGADEQCTQTQPESSSGSCIQFSFHPSSLVGGALSYVFSNVFQTHKREYF